MDILRCMNYYNIPGVSITCFEKAQISWNQSFGVAENGTTKMLHEHSIFHACSISKMITSLCVLSLAQKGLLDMNKDVNEYLTSWKIPYNELLKEKKITLSNLLAHQAGFRDIENSFEPYQFGDYIPKTLDILKGTTCYHAEELHAKYIPETDFCYSDAGYCVIEQVLEDIFGKNIAQLSKEMIFQPLGLSHTFFWEIGKEPFTGIQMSDCVIGHNRDGIVVDEVRACYPNIGGAALWTTPTELSIIVLDIIRAYHDMKSVVLNKEMATLMLTPYGCAEYAGMGVFLEQDENGNPYFFSQGWGVGMQCKLRAYYNAQSGVVVMTNSDPGAEQEKALVGKVIESICKEFSF